MTHAGTARREDGAIVTAGGRVLNVTALGTTLHRRATPPMLPRTRSISRGASYAATSPYEPSRAAKSNDG